MKERSLMPYGINLLNEYNYKPIFISISGAYLYGFPSKNSDVDLRATHIFKTDNLFKLNLPKDVVNKQFKVKEENIDFESLNDLVNLAYPENL